MASVRCPKQFWLRFSPITIRNDLLLHSDTLDRNFRNKLTADYVASATSSSMLQTRHICAKLDQR